MSGSLITGINYGLLFQSGTSTQTTGLLGAIYGNGPSNNSASAAYSLQALQTAETNETKDVAVTAKEPAVARDLAAFKAAVTSAKTPAALLKNPTVLKVLLTANGLAAQIPYTALVQKALLSNLSDSNSLANQLSGTTPQWKTVAGTYNFATQGLSVIQQPSVLATIANAYAEATWRQSLDATTPGLSNALTFRAEAGGIKTADQVLGDPVLRDVITTAFNIPQQIAFQGLPEQEKAITNQLDFSKLTNQHYIDTITQQYLLNKASAAATTTTTPTLDQLVSQSNGLVV